MAAPVSVLRCGELGWPGAAGARLGGAGGALEAAGAGRRGAGAGLRGRCGTLREGTASPGGHGWRRGPGVFTEGCPSPLVRRESELGITMAT